MATTTMSFILRPLCVSTTSTILSKYPLHKSTFLSSSIRTPPLLFSRSLFCSLTSHSPTKDFTPTFSLAQDQEKLDIVEASGIQESDVVESSEGEDDEAENVARKENIGSGGGGGAEVVELPKLTVKEKKELASYAHSLGKKLKCQSVGKSGVTQSLVSAFIENLESNELLKVFFFFFVYLPYFLLFYCDEYFIGKSRQDLIKIHGTCPVELEDAVKQLEKATGSVVVGQIGRTIIVYRPSLTKLKAEEKKRQVRRVYVRKESKMKPLLLVMNKAEKPPFLNFF
ncbi:hypothetical protein JRO89_XS02G0034300 [Xanthoceras sorbifolium]|uniref:CRM domain-containing protein n=1 Tax=Xanthoceras sorbifolium TaxID=99658 RepID=A0ABQ8IEZ8_9ROSI|nr:hypothetical protein JRO89_XS02G0034300 [Xanthoceras sorbifolium]